jgi:hypothetical protein
MGKKARGRRRMQDSKDWRDPPEIQHPLSLTFCILFHREKRQEGSGDCKMPKTVVLLRRILTLVIPVLYILFVTGLCLSMLYSYNLYLPVF